MTTQQLMPITIDGQHGLAYCDDWSIVRGMLKNADAMEALVASVESSVLGLVYDPLTQEGRKQGRENGEFAAKVVRRFVKIRTEALADLKSEPKRIEDFVRPYIKRLESIAEQATAPIREIDARSEKLRLIADRPNILTAAPAKELRVELAQAEAMDVSPSIWREATDTAIAVKAGLIDALNTMLEKRVEVERQQAEFEAFQRKQAEEKQEREKEEARQQGVREGEARAKSKAEQDAIEEAKAKQRTVEAVTREIAAEATPVAPTAPIADDDFDSDKSRIERYTMRIPPVPELRDADKRARIIDIINRAVSAIKGV